MSFFGFCLFHFALKVLFHPQRLKQVGFHMGSNCWLSSSCHSHLPSLFPQMHREKTLLSFHYKDINFINFHRNHVRHKQPSFLLGKFLSTCLNLISLIVFSVGFQSHTLSSHCQAKDHILKSQLCDSLNPEFCSLSYGFQP